MQTENQLIGEIRTFVRYQFALTKALFEANPLSTDFSMLLDFPRHGEISTLGRNWKYKRHGIGFEFTSLSDGVVIDIHRNVSDPNIVDSWRLLNYFESRGSSVDLHSLENQLRECEKAGLLVGSGQSYRLPNSDE